MRKVLPTTADNAAKYAGLDDLHEMVFYSGIKLRTLQNWFHSNRQAFDCMLAGAVMRRLSTL